MQRIEIPGFVMVLAGDNYLEEQIIRTGQWEPSTTEFLRRTLQPGMAVVDVGANVGYFSFLMASLVGAEGQVHSFEPYPGYIERMRINLKANSFNQIYLNEYALSDKKQQHELYKGLASARMHRWSHPDPVFNKVHDKVIVPCIRFDEYADKNLQKLDLIKIDVDGYEMNVLTGASNSIERYHPIILIELYEEALNDAGSSASEILKLLYSWNYLPYSEQGQLFQNNHLLRLVTADVRTSMNVVFRPEPVSNSSSVVTISHRNNRRFLSSEKNEDTHLSQTKPTLGLVINRSFHEENRWCSATTFYIVEAIKEQFQCVYIQNQSDYEKNLGALDVLVSMEPGWAAPVLELTKTGALREKLCAIPSYILLSDPHARQWRQDYFLQNEFDFVLTFYYYPVRYHFRKIHPRNLVHFPWAIPDHWVKETPIYFHDQSKIWCYGGSKSDAYELRNWCRTFEFVQSATNSGVENKIMTDDEYIEWLSQKDAAIAAGSDAPKYQLTVPKYFEIPAAGALLFAQHTKDLALLGFRHMENCVIFNRPAFEESARKYLADPASYLKIREAGRELIRRRHTLSQRMLFFKRHISMVRQKKTRQQMSSLSPIIYSQKLSIDKSFPTMQLERDKAYRSHRSPVAETKPSFTRTKSESETVNAADHRQRCEALGKGALISSKTLPRILFIVDEPGWAHDFKADNLIRSLENSYDMCKCYETDVTADDINRADLVVVFYWSQFANHNMKKLLDVFQRNKHKLLLGICSHHELSGERRENGLSILKNLAAAVFVHNMFLYREFLPVFEVPFFYTPNGVDKRFFTPSSNERITENLRIGWAGSLTNHGNKRGYYDFIVPAVDMIEGVELVTAAREQKLRNHNQMRRFYRSLDVYICASRTEGTPNPCLEAAACGVPLVTTRVGNMPELVKHGANGFFIERDIRDIVSKLTLLRDNLSLRHHLSRSILSSIGGWDWQYQAQNYRTMFDAILSAQNKQQNKLFKSTSQVYLASADRMDNVLNNVAALKQLGSQQVDTFATVIGGLSGLNYLLSLEPKKIVFFDINLTALGYARLIAEMISISDSPRDFISRMFSRRIKEFLNSSGQKDLTVDNQKKYLQTRVNEDLLAETLSLLSGASRNTYRAFIGPHLTGRVLDGVRNCRCLLPCWPVNERVPVGGGQALGANQQGQLVPNTNTFFYGYGWMGSKENFARIKKLLNKATVSFVPLDLLKQDLLSLGDWSLPLVIHASNIDDWFPAQWVERVNFWVSQSLKHQGALALITTNGGVQVPAVDPHQKAFTGLEPYVIGRIVEITHKVPWGFHEFDRINVTFTDYLVQDYPADTTILHILIGEGVSRDVFAKVYEKAVKNSRRVIVLEHNRLSGDWKSRDTSHFVTADEIYAMLKEVNTASEASFTCHVKLAGQSDLQRNIMFVIDCRSTKSHLMPVIDLKNSRPPSSDTSADTMVSVIMPAYNAAEYIVKAIESVLVQDYGNFELIIVDDGSTDQTKDIVHSFKDERIKYFYHENAGLAATHNEGIRKSKGDFLVKLDHDDMIAQDFIARHLREFERHPEADLVYCDDLLIGEDSKPIRVIERPEYTDRKLLIRDLFRRGFPVVPFRTCIRRSVFDKIGLFDEDLLLGEDYDMIRRFVRHGLKVRHLKTALYLRRITSDSLSRNHSAQNAKCLFEILKRFVDTFTYDELFPDVDWDKIAPEMRQLYAKCLAAVTYLAIGQEYIKSNAPIYTQMAFEQACSELRDCLKTDPGNRQVQQLLQKCEVVRQRYDEKTQQAVC